MNTAPKQTDPPEFPELEALPTRIADAVGGLLNAPHWMGLALHLPLRFEDKTSITAMDALHIGQKANLLATVIRTEVQYQPRKQLRVWVQDNETHLLLRWLHFYPSLRDKLSEGTRIQISGQIRQGYGSLEMVHPTIKVASFTDTPTATTPSDTPSGILEPVYPSSGPIKQLDWQRWMAKLPSACFEDTLPENILAQHQLMPWAKALQTLHGQATPDQLFALNQRNHPAWTRIKLDELLAQQLQLREFRQQRTQERAIALHSINNTSLTEAFLKQLPFSPTQAQQRAINEIFSDLEHHHPMQRLLQGDVGSGKTLVAAMACLKAVENGHQAAILAPTEVLAAQHHHKLSPLFESIGVRCSKLQGAMKKSEKTKVLEALNNGEIHIVIGTHALVQEHVQFKSLALVIVDEQHRFGVAQRLAMISKSNGSLAHQLMMSATPIPRTLAQTYLSDLAVSNLDEKPPGRKPIITKLLSQKKREQLIESIELELNKGQQVYWVCPLIEENETLDLQAAQATYQQLSEALPHRQIALLHGQQDNAYKQSTMNAFAAGEIHLLVSTTVIEVGVDVSNASLMVIDQAERFGLAQLHQLRGRVGRGSIQSLCVLLYGQPLSHTAKMRLQAMHESDDGFYLAERDLEIRGPGELLGKRQSGMPLLRYADPITEKNLLEQARNIAQTMPTQAANTRRHIARWTEQTPWWLS